MDGKIFEKDDLIELVDVMDTFPHPHKSLDMELVKDRMRSALEQYIGQTVDEELIRKLRNTVHKSIDAAFDEMDDW